MWHKVMRDESGRKRRIAKKATAGSKRKKHCSERIHGQTGAAQPLRKAEPFGGSNGNSSEAGTHARTQAEQ